MAINLLALEPHKVSRDLSGYITYIYGAPKVGKSTLGSQMPDPLFLAFERGYNALPGVIAQDITTWAEMKMVLRELKKSEVQQRFRTIVVDTVDIAAALCEKYICSQHEADSIAAVGAYGQGWNILKKEFEETFRLITQYGYAVIFISHEKEGIFKRQDNTEYSVIRPSVANTYNAIIENMADIYGRMFTKIEDGQSKVKLMLRSKDGTVTCGGRFKYIAEEIDGDYDSLVKALSDAIDTEASKNGNKFVTDTRENATIKTEYNYDELKASIDAKVEELSTKYEVTFATDYAPRIVQIVEKYLGKGKKVSQTSRDQAEQLFLINEELKDIT